MPRVKIDPSKLPGKLPIPDLALCNIYRDKIMAMVGKGIINCAYVPSMDAGAWILSFVVSGQGGHYPLPTSFCFGTEHQVQQVADHLNREHLKASADSVAYLIAQSMRAS